MCLSQMALVIDGPRRVYMNGWTEVSTLPPNVEAQTMGVEVSLRPIGYDESYSVLFHVGPSLEASHSSDPNDVNWVLVPDSRNQSGTD